MSFDAAELDTSVKQVSFQLMSILIVTKLKTTQEKVRDDSNSKAFMARVDCLLPSLLFRYSARNSTA